MRATRAASAALAVALAAALALALGTRAALLPLEAQRLRAGVGGYAVMNCHLDFPFGNEIPYHLQWQKDGEAIFSWYSGDAEPRLADRWGGRVRRVGGGGGAAGAAGAGGAGGAALGGGSINVSSVRETDAGLYRCHVTFPNRTPPARNNGTFYYLAVDGAGGNLIATPPSNVTVVEGEPAELECQPKRAEWAVRWYREGVPLDALPELAARSERARNGSLLLRRTASADLGPYECRVSADDGRRQSAAAYLDVQYKAKVLTSPKERYLPYGKPASLDCHFSANPPLTNLRWEKDGFLFDPYNVPGVFYTWAACGVRQVEEAHEGQYSCTAYNALGSAGASGAVRVRVQRPPALAARPQPLYLARLGAALRLPCAPAADARAPPAVRWTRKDGSELPPGRHALDGGNLTISEVAEEDRGVYVCTVSNEADTVTVETELLIENVPPRAPYNLSAVPAYDSIHLSWLPGGGALGAEYHVWYRERADSEWRTMKILSRGVTDATLLGLRAATPYELRVLAQDHIGDGLFSKPLLVTTLDPEVGEREGATAFAAATTTEPAGEAAPGEAGEAALAGEAGEAGETGALDVTVRLLEDGALVRWRAADAGAGAGAEAEGARCTLRWYRDDAPAPQLLLTAHTRHDYILVDAVEEGAAYWARVQCGGGGGGARVQVPQYARLRGVAVGAAAGALLLAALAGALLLARRRLRARLAPHRPHQPHQPHQPRLDKRAR